jgi:hypothetical protein
VIEWIQDNKWRIVIPEGTMHKFRVDNKPYVVNLMCNSFNAFRNYLQTGRLGLFDGLSAKDWETVRKIAIGRRDIPLKLNLA